MTDKEIICCLQCKLYIDEDKAGCQHEHGNIELFDNKYGECEYFQSFAEKENG